MKILLVSFYEELDTIGLKYLHYTLLENGYESSMLFLPFFNPANKKHLRNIKNFMLQMNPSLIGISLMSYEHYRAGILTRCLKSFIKSSPIIWGGIHPTISPQDCLNCADYACRGEGERTILDIANALSRNESIKNINNLCYMENSKIKTNPLYPPVENLDEIPAYEHIPRNSFILSNGQISGLDKKVFKRYARHLGRIYNVITSRGCPFSCTYCINNFITSLYQSNKIRKRSALNVIEELHRALKDNPEIEYINFQDDCFLACSDEYLSEFCKIYKEKIGKPFIIRSIPIYITRNKIKSLKDAGMSWISLGLQTGSNHILKEVYKRKSLKEDFLKAARMVKDFNLAAFYDIILDNPFEDEEDKLETIETLMQTPKPFYTQVSSLAFYCGTELYEKAKLECPQYLKEDYLKKNHLVSHKNVINSLTRLATFLDEKKMAKLVRLYRQNPKSIRFKMRLFITNILAFFIFQSLTYFKIIRLSQRGSFEKTFRVLPIYFKEGIKRYLNQFRGEREEDAIL